MRAMSEEMRVRFECDIYARGSPPLARRILHAVVLFLCRGLSEHA